MNRVAGPGGIYFGRIFCNFFFQRSRFCFRHSWHRFLLHQHSAFASAGQGSLKQIGMGSSAVKQDAPVLFVNTVHKKPVRLNITFPFAFPLSTMQGVVMVPRKKGLFADKHTHYRAEFNNIFAALFLPFNVSVNGNRSFITEQDSKLQNLV